MKLREYQVDSISRLRRAMADGARRPLLVAPTGSGKTVLAGEVIRMARERSSYVLFLAPRRELIMQASGKLDALGIPHGIIMAGVQPSPYHQIQVASFDTLHARGVRDDRIEMPKADLVIVDEAHLSIAPSRREILNCYPKARIVGLTATPARGDGKGLGAVYDRLIETVTVRELTEQGYLVPVRYFAPSQPDLHGLKLNRDGDYIERGLAGVMDQPRLIGDVVTNWLRLASDRQTVVFCVNRAHSRHLQREFEINGVKAEHLDGETPAAERREILQRVASGETQVLCNVHVATYGIDLPPLECAVLARPTRNLSLYLQTVGRVLRPSPDTGKVDALVIDHAGAVAEHGFVDEPVPWSLDVSTKIAALKQRKREEAREPVEMTCAHCATVFKARRDCPSCGAQVIPPERDIPVHEADLEEVKTKAQKAADMDMTARVSWYGQLLGHAALKGYKPGWARHAYKDKFGEYPSGHRFDRAQPSLVSEPVMNWIKHRNIRMARGRAAQGRRHA